MICIPKHSERNLIIPARLSMQGRYRMQVYRPDGRMRMDTGWFRNLITDAGLNFMGDNNGWLGWCKVGSGTASPANSDTSLASFVAATSTRQTSVLSAQSTSPYYASRTNTYRFASGDAAGNLSEVGIGASSDTTDPLFSRSLIQDGSGSPTTITVLADEVLDVSYELRVVPPTTDSTFNVTDTGPAGTVHTFTVRASSVTTAGDNNDEGWGISETGSAVELDNGGFLSLNTVYDGAIGSITQSPSGTSDRASSINTDAYSNNSLERTATQFYDLNDGNLGAGISAVRWKFLSMGSWQAGIDPAIPKTDTDVLTLGYKVSWARTSDTL